MDSPSPGPDWDPARAARILWQRFEPIHAVTYFSTECDERYRTLGLKGFWMGYFASRSAPFGRCSPELANATFFNFRPSMAERALPDAWSFASPDEVLSARLEGSVVTLRVALGDLADGPEVDEAADLAEAAARSARSLSGGRPLFAALSALPWPADPLARLWHAATLLREHRGDGHVAANVAAGLDGLGAHVTFVATGAIPRARLQGARGWTDEEWSVAERLLTASGWLQDGRLTDEGERRRAAVEATTDDLAAPPWVAVGHDAARRLADLLEPLAGRVARAGAVPFPNPIGVPPPTDSGESSD